jgi:hypothetical protein
MRVLFIGNSQMMVDRLPEMIRALAESAPPDAPRIEVGQALVGGSSLKTHWTPETRARIASGSWEWVVIQDIYSVSQNAFETYAALTGRSPIGLTGEFSAVRDGMAIPASEAAVMQQAAWDQYLADHRGPPA